MKNVVRALAAGFIAGTIGFIAIDASKAAVAGNAQRGATLYQDKCTGCHSIDSNRVGPAHRGVFGRKAGLAPGFAYSPGLKKSKIIWNDATLDRGLTNPQATIPRAHGLPPRRPGAASRHHCVPQDTRREEDALTPNGSFPPGSRQQSTFIATVPLKGRRGNACICCPSRTGKGHCG